MARSADEISSQHKRKRDNATNDATEMIAANIPSSSPHFVCEICQSPFPSRNRLFGHLRELHESDLLDAPLPASAFLTAAERTAAATRSRAHYHNPHLDAYYRLQASAGGGVLTLPQWETALEYFRRPLPVAIRLTKSVPPDDVRWTMWKLLQQNLPSNALLPSPFFPTTSNHNNNNNNNNNTSSKAWHATAWVAHMAPREWPQMAQQLLMDGQECGLLYRQELVSMIPVLLLLQDQNPTGTTADRTILDLCAAPGSKSLQLLDDTTNISTSTSLDSIDNESNSYSTSMIIGNDTSRNRLMIVSRRLRRQGNTEHVLLNCSDGRFFPALRHAGRRKLKFTHVLADVPCSGDGTLRKLGGTTWKEWSVANHLRLHHLQVRLLTRALQCLAQHGRLVYSTCSLDPIENEAVVTTAIINAGGPHVVRIVPMPQYLGGGHDTKDQQPFPYSPGAKTWVVPHPHFGSHKPQHADHVRTTYSSYEQVPAELHTRGGLTPSMFPPRFRGVVDNNGSIDNELDILMMEEMLPNCARILPQHLDSGGFFCAILEKVPPTYFPVCCPSLRNGTQYPHGRVFHSTNGEDVEQLRTRVIVPSRGQYYFQGCTTLAMAQEWLRQQKAYLAGISDSPVPVEDGIHVFVPGETSGEAATADHGNQVSDNHRDAAINAANGNDTDMVNPIIEDNKDGDNHANSKKRDKKPVVYYTPIYKSPHPSLSQEFCSFFGLCTTEEEAHDAGVHRFPVENLVFVGGGPDASLVDSCLDLDVAHQEVVCGEDPAANGDGDNTKPNAVDDGDDNNIGEENAQKDSKKLPGKIPNKRRFLQLVLVSKQIRSLYAGGAKFNPVETGQALCWVAVPGQWTRNSRSQRRPFKNHRNKQGQTTEQITTQDSIREPPVGLAEGDDDLDMNEASGTLEEDEPTSRAARSGRFGLSDGGAEFIARCATRRVVALTMSEALALCSSSVLDIKCPGANDQDAPPKPTSPWDRRWGKDCVQSLASWSAGAVIAVVRCNKNQENDQTQEQQPTLFLSCLLKHDDKTNDRRLVLLTETNLVDVWVRLLKLIVA